EGAVAADAGVRTGPGHDVEPSDADLMGARQRERLALEAGDDRSLLPGVGLGPREATGIGRSGRCDREIADVGGAGVRAGARGDEGTRARVGTGEMEIHAEVELLGRVAGGGKRGGDRGCGTYDGQADRGEAAVEHEAHTSCSFLRLRLSVNRAD